MKNAITRVLILLFAVCSYAQQGINYKALIKDDSNNVVANQLITVRFQILESPNMTIVYQETHTPTTDADGLIIINIGEGTTNSGVFADIDWGRNNHFLKTQIDPGTGFIDIGTIGFNAVPYALQANTATNAATAENGIPSGGEEGQVLSLVGGVPTWTWLGPTPPEPAVIGDFRDGGVVVWVDPLDNTKGLVISIENLTDTYPNEGGWADGQNWVEVGVSSDVSGGIGDGPANTDAIILAQGPPTAANDYAAWKCREYRGGGFDDWFLPSIDELLEARKYREVVNTISLENGGDIFHHTSVELHGGYFYWTSNEAHLNDSPRFRAHIVLMSDCDINGTNYGVPSPFHPVQYNGKGNKYQLRAYRAF